MEKLEVLYSDYKITCEYLYKLRTYFRVPFFFPIYLFFLAVLSALLRQGEWGPLFSCGVWASQ